MSFSSGLCDCFSDCDICICAFCCPCVQFGLNVTKHETMFPCGGGIICCLTLWASLLFCPITLGVVPLWLVLQNRVHIRHNMGLGRNDCGDCLEIVFCGPCVIAQEGRELKGH